jgi:hypothetical protein
MKMKTVWWAVGAFAAYEVIAWKVNTSRIVAGNASLLPFDFLGQALGYPGAPQPLITSATTVVGQAALPAPIGG